MEQVKLKQPSSQSADERKAEADRVITIIHDDDMLRQMNTWERGFVSKMATSKFISPDQLVKLREIKDRYL